MNGICGNRKGDDFAPLGLRIFDGRSIHRALPYAIDVRALPYAQGYKSSVKTENLAINIIDFGALPYAQENISSIKAESLAINSIGQRPMNRNTRKNEAPQGRNQPCEQNIIN